MRIFLVSFLIFMILGTGGLVGLFEIGGKDLPSPSRLQTISPALKTTVYDRNDRIIGQFFREDRSLVTLDQLPPRLVAAFLAVEDRRFRRHWGIDLAGIVRAATHNLVTGQRHGASTITQQLARNLFLTREQTLKRKIKEAVLALRIEQAYSKDEILEMYLNQIYFGEGAYGVQAAARNFFGKDVGDLTLGECALLAGLPRNPRDYSPRRHPDRARTRRAIVLAAMESVGDISSRERARADAESLRVAAAPLPTTNAPYFMEMVRQFLTARYGSDSIYQDGLTVHTTLDLPLQQASERFLEDHITRLEEDTRSKTSRKRYLEKKAAGEKPKLRYLEGAALVLDAPSGAVLTLIGGRSFEESPFNRAVQAKRQPGSAMKPFVYLTAIERGFYPSYMIMDSPVVFNEPGQDPWSPQNYDHKFRGPVTLRYALQKSLNVPTIKLQEEFGPRAVIETARAAGITSPLPPYRSLALGTAEVSLMELTSAYAVFANDGIRVEPYFIDRVEDRLGNVVDEFRPERSEVLRPESVGLLDNMLRSVIDEGTGYGARRAGFTRPAAGKTGTTDDYTDAWFVGFTPRTVAGVWVGYDVKRTIGRRMTGAAAALPIWTNIMKEATRDREPLDFELPEGVVQVEVCSDTGLPASPQCPLGEMEYFLADHVPTDQCYLHGAHLDLRLRERWERLHSTTDWNNAPEEERYPNSDRATEAPHRQGEP